MSSVVATLCFLRKFWRIALARCMSGTSDASLTGGRALAVCAGVGRDELVDVVERDGVLEVVDAVA